jgi:hypothetical protein
MPAHTFGTLANPTLDVRLPEPVAAHAAAELGTFLGPAGGGKRITVSLQPSLGDGFAVEVAGDGVGLLGATPRRALDAVYALLEGLGILFVEPGKAGEVRLAGRSLPSGKPIAETPAIPRRTLILGCDGFHDDWRDWVEWASRNRYDDVFFHDTPPSLLRRAMPRPQSNEGMVEAGGGWMFERWDREGGAIRAALAQRAMTLQFGGHHLPALVPREAFAKHPEWFPVRRGERNPRYNLCTSSAGAMATLRDGARAFVARFAGADVYHLWADDIRGGGWCDCDGCSTFSPSDQALRATNAVAGAVADVSPGARVAHLAYHDTLAPPARETAAGNVVALFAPRERCYAHAIDDATCARNRRDYWEPLQGLPALVDNDPSRLHVFEYYSDAILFKGLAPPHAAVLPRDVAAYAAAGAGNLQNLVVSPRPWIGPPLHAWWFARAARDPAATWHDALDLFTRAAFPQSHHAAGHYYGLQDDAYHRLLDLLDLEPAPRRDVLDYSSEPRATLATKASEALLGAAALAARHQQLLKTSSATLHERQRIAREQVQAEIVAAIARHLASRTAAWNLALAGRKADALPHLAAAERALETAERWHAEHAGPAWAVLAQGQLRAARHHTAEVRDLLA